MKTPCWKAGHGGWKKLVLDYDLATPMMLVRYFPSGLLGLGLCALIASFMSGMAGNTTAFNTVWTYDIYQSYINKTASDQHYLWMGRAATVFGLAISLMAAFVAKEFNNILDVLQLVFAFVNAPLFATFMLGMFWKRTTGHGAFWGLLGGTVAAATHYGLTAAGWRNCRSEGRIPGADPARLSKRDGAEFLDGDFRVGGVLYAYSRYFPADITAPGRRIERRLVYSLTAKPEEGGLKWYQKPATLAVIVLVLLFGLNLVFW